MSAEKDGYYWLRCLSELELFKDQHGTVTSSVAPLSISGGILVYQNKASSSRNSFTENPLERLRQFCGHSHFLRVVCRRAPPIIFPEIDVKS
jgi:hypothetical protein